MIYTPRQHQAEDKQFMLDNDRVLDFSDPGTGKTGKCIITIDEMCRQGNGKTLVLGTKSILKPAWGDDIVNFAPHLTFSIAYAHNRERAFAREAEIYITNHDAAVWLSENFEKYLQGFSMIVIDEAKAFKNPSSQRSKALYKIIKHFPKRILMTGTPYSNGGLDLWNIARLCDGGMRLGTNFHRFRNQICVQRLKPGTIYPEWIEKPDAKETIAELLSDITIRRKLDECTDIPPQEITPFRIDLAPGHMKKYKVFQRHSVLELADGELTAFTASAARIKLLQIASGAVYDGEGNPQIIDQSRYAMVGDMIEEHGTSLTMYNWRHQKAGLEKEWKKRKFRHGFIDGSVSSKQREYLIEAMQGGDLDVLGLQPKAASHGITLTAAKTTIWVSPTYDAEMWEQANARNYRDGQTEKTRVICLIGNDTYEETQYNILANKLDAMVEFESFIESMTRR